MAQRELTYNYTVDRKSDGIRINNCYIEMVDAGVWIYQKEDSNRLFLPYSNIDMIIEYSDSASKLWILKDKR